MKLYTFLLVAALTATAAVGIVEATSYDTNPPPAYPGEGKDPYKPSKPKSKKCKDGQTKCSGDKLKVCEYGSWRTKPCSGGKVCKKSGSKAKCTKPAYPTKPGKPTTPYPDQKCTADESKCKGGNQLEVCEADKWVIKPCTGDEVCEAKGSKATCTKPTPEPVDGCKNGDTRCDGDKLSTCRNNQWKSSSCSTYGETCQTDGTTCKCTKPTLPYPGANPPPAPPACTGTETKCDGNKLNTCKDGKWEIMDCVSKYQVCLKEGEASKCTSPPPPTTR